MTQRMDALAEANRVNIARGQLKRDIYNGTVSVADVLDRCPWEAERMTIFNLLRSQRRWGSNRTRVLLAELQISELSRVGELTERQCKQISFYIVPWRAAV
jgi:hypothetical protein